MCQSATTDREDDSQVIELVEILRHSLVSPLHYVIVTVITRTHTTGHDKQTAVKVRI